MDPASRTTLPRMNPSRTSLLFVALIALLALVSGCMADPPPPVKESAPPATPAEYPTEKTVYIATGSIGSGFNPHIAADQSTVTTAVAAMTLPSAFDPVITPEGTRWVRSAALLTSAEVTGTAPFTVTYRIETDAQWSDGLPVTGDDFTYLWQQMSRQPNVVAPAGYRLIDSVQSSAGGKVVQVRFAQAYPDWRQLFTNLLPSHVLRGAPAGFQTGLDSGKPVSAGPYSVVSIDPTRDEVRLVRNDRYWRTPPTLDQVVLRRAGTVPQMVGSVRSRDSSIVDVGAGPAMATELAAVPGTATRRNPTSRAMTVSVNTRTSTMRDLPVRQAILGMINANLVIAAAAGDEVVTPYANTVYAPTDPGYTPVARDRPAPGQIETLLRGAGYTRGAPQTSSSGSGSTGSGSAGTGESSASSSPSTTPAVSSGADTGASDSSDASGSDDDATSGDSEAAGAESMAPVPTGVAPFQKDGKDLVVRVGAISGDPRSTSGAATIVDQLRAAGVRSEVSELPNSELYGVALTNARVDLVVGWTGLGVPPAAGLASQVDCDQPKPGTEPSLSTPPTPTSVAPGQDGNSSDDSYASNVSGLCNPELIGIAREALSATDPSSLLAQAEPLLAEQAVYLPIYQDTTLVGVTDNVRNVPLDGPIQVGIFGDAVNWELR